jgi:hypothetical protein
VPSGVLSLGVVAGFAELNGPGVDDGEGKLGSRRLLMGVPGWRWSFSQWGAVLKSSDDAGAGSLRIAWARLELEVVASSGGVGGKVGS